jgi:hypothetical protein
MLAQWRAAARGGAAAPSVPRPLPAAAIRRLHWWLVWIVALAIPLLFAIAVALRPAAAG